MTTLPIQTATYPLPITVHNGDSQLMPASDGLSLRELMQILRRRQLWFGVTFGVCLTAVGFVTLRQWLFSPMYQGTFRLLVQDPLSDTRSSTGRLDDLALQSSSVDAPNLIDVLTSPMLLNPLAKKLNLPEGSLGDKVTVSRRDDKSDVLDVSLLWGNPEEGLAVLKGIENQYLAYSLQQRQEKLRQGLQFLDSQAPELQQRVAMVQQQLADFRRQNSLLAPEDQSRQLEGARGELEAQQRRLGQVEARLLGMQALVQSGQLLSPFQAQAATSTGRTADVASGSDSLGGAFTPLFSELTEVESQLAKASSSFRKDSPLVANLVARRDKLRPLLQRRERDAITSALQENRAQQRKVDQQVAELDLIFRRNPDLIKRYEAVQQRLDVARENLVSYLRARETFRLEVAQRTVPWQVIQSPGFGVIPVKPDLQRNLLLGSLLGLLAGSGVAFARDRIDHVFHKAREVEQALGMPVLVGIPFMPEAGVESIQELVKSLDSDKRFALRESLRNFYQALRMLRANRTLRVLAMTSSESGEGKTTAVSLLGLTLAELGMKVLLVDGDLRRMSLHRRLGVDNSRGWAELFGESPPPLEGLYQWVSPNLAVLPGGPRVPDAARLLTSPRCKEAVEEIRNLPGFDLVIFDTPPALELVARSVGIYLRK
jgi:polysaccharide biosynthesis transport protein